MLNVLPALNEIIKPHLSAFSSCSSCLESPQMSGLVGITELLHVLWDNRHRRFEQAVHGEARFFIPFSLKYEDFVIEQEQLAVAQKEWESRVLEVGIASEALSRDKGQVI
jgi:hypothetical protein